MMRAFGKTTVILVAGLLLLAAAANAAVYDIEKDPFLYGNLSQNDPGLGGIGPSACGPVAAVNSFVYLENAYPATYDRLLVPDDNPPNAVHDNAELVSTALVLTGPSYMNTANPGGTEHDDFIWGKAEYVEDVAPNRTRYEAWDNYNWVNPVRPKPDWVNIGGVDKMFLYQELVACEDVEILMIFGLPPDDWGHYVTMTSFDWNDADDNGIMTFAENASMGFVDPIDGLHYTTHIWDDSGYTPYGAIETEVWPNVGQRGHITMAVSESPVVVPEPAYVSLLGFGVLAALRRRRKM